MGMVIILEIARIVLAAAVGYIVANKMAVTSVAMNGNTEEKKKITNTEEEGNTIPAMISFSNASLEASNTDKRPLLLKSSMQSDDIDESDRCSSVMSVDPPGLLVRQRSKRMNDLSEIDPPFHVQAESMWKKQQTIIQKDHDETTSLYDIDSGSSSSIRMIQQEEDTHHIELMRLQRIHQHQTSINMGKKKIRRRMSSISWEDTDGEEDEAEAPTKQMPPFLAKYQSSEQEKEETYKKNVTNRRGSKQKQDDIRLMLGLHSSSEKSTYTRRNSYYTLARSPKLSCLRKNRRKSASNAAA